VKKQRAGCIGGFGFCAGSEMTEIDFLSIRKDSHAPQRAAKRDTFKPGSAAAPSMPQVFLAGAVAKVPDAIVSGLVVDVIDLSGRMFAFNVEPGEAMGVMKAAVDLNGAIAIWLLVPAWNPAAAFPRESRQ
jgi:hypothetical protein